MTNVLGMTTLLDISCALPWLTLLSSPPLPSPLLPSPHWQCDDQHHPGGHHRHAASPEHGQVLERPAHHLRHTQTSGGAHEERPVPPAPPHGGP